MTTWKCRKCKYVYDPAVGDPDGGILPGTPFEQIPDTWQCPICGAKKSDFFVLTSPPPKAPRAGAQPAMSTSTSAAASVPVPAAGYTVGSLKGKPQR